jgi:phosphoribosylformylglycinamidine cyclo-ligase
VDADKIATIVAGIAEGCVQAGCALLGGETAEHPGLMASDEYDISGTGIGVVNSDAILGPDRVEAGDVLIALASSGLHSNGFSLVRHVIASAGLALTDTPVQLGGRTLGAELLTPTRIYALDCLALASEAGAHAFAHITGGGLAGNLARVLPPGLRATVDRATWAPPPIFGLIAAAGNIALDEQELAFNQGVGMIAVVAADRVSDALAIAAARAVPAWVVGSVTAGSGAESGQVTMTGTHT